MEHEWKGTCIPVILLAKLQKQINIIQLMLFVYILYIEAVHQRLHWASWQGTEVWSLSNWITRSSKAEYCSTFAIGSHWNSQVHMNTESNLSCIRGTCSAWILTLNFLLSLLGEATMQSLQLFLFGPKNSEIHMKGEIECHPSCFYFLSLIDDTSNSQLKYI